ncbi:hypothetical protein [Vibrio sp. WXL210]
MKEIKSVFPNLERMLNQASWFDDVAKLDLGKTDSYLSKLIKGAWFL